MNKLKLYCTIMLLGFSMRALAQTVYVDAVNGKEKASGTIADPLLSLEKAIIIANSFTGDEPINIKLAPGLYVVSREMTVKTRKTVDDNIKLTIEATIMPNDKNWKPEEMPVIQSVSANNSSVPFTHSAAFLVAKSNVSFKGLKFVGNASPDVAYYYPIRRENGNLNGLEVSQCYFIGEKNSTRLQSGLWTDGAGIHVDHCIFYNCRCGMVLIMGIKNLSITHSIICGAYESAIWFGHSVEPFVFSNNIVTRCNFFWVMPKDSKASYTFSNSLITENDNYMGYIANDLVPAPQSKPTEHDIRKTGHVALVEIKTDMFQPHDYLNLAPGSAGRDIEAGIFKNERR